MKILPRMGLHILTTSLSFVDIGTDGLFTTNCIESVNNLMKLWNEREKQDLYNFCLAYESLAEQQEQNLLNACLGLDSESTVVLKQEFLNQRMTFTEFSKKTADEKNKIKASRLNILVDRQNYRQLQ